MELRPYQTEARDSILGEWETGRRKTLLVLPTGTGKTVVFCGVAEEVVRRGGRVLILAHRAELLDQAADKLKRATGLACSVEKAEQTSVGEWERITVGSVQTMMRPSRLAKFRQDHFAAIIVDEAHHALADTYQRILSHFCEANVLGVTATPDRGDKKNLGKFFDSLAFEYSLVDAIHDGYLCRIAAKTIPLDIDLTSVSQQNGDYELAGVATALDPYLEKIADVMSQHRERKVVVFLPLIATSKKFAHMLRKRGLDATEINGETRDRKERLDQFDRAGPSVLCNAMLLTEGWDCPSVDAICVLRPTRIRSLYAQMVGRGTRIHDGKDHLLLLDFLWHTARHELCRPAGLVAESDELAQKMTELITDQSTAGAAVDIGEVEDEAKGAMLVEREEALAKRLREQRAKSMKLVDPLQYSVSISSEDLVDYQPEFEWESAPASSEQIESLEKAGISCADGINAGLASRLLRNLSTRRASGMATPKQIRLLERKGFQHVGRWTFSDASRMISRISAAGWRVPRGVYPSTYFPEDEHAGV